jgi:hypothetical protein
MIALSLRRKHASTLALISLFLSFALLSSRRDSVFDPEFAVEIARDHAKSYSSKKCRSKVNFDNASYVSESLEVNGEIQNYYDIKLRVISGILPSGEVRVFVYDLGPMSRNSSGASEIVADHIWCN